MLWRGRYLFFALIMHHDSDVCLSRKSGGITYVLLNFASSAGHAPVILLAKAFPRPIQGADTSALAVSFALSVK
jgi:hypothetical protein